MDAYNKDEDRKGTYCKEHRFFIFIAAVDNEAEIRHFDGARFVSRNGVEQEMRKVLESTTDTRQKVGRAILLALNDMEAYFLGVSGPTSWRWLYLTLRFLWSGFCFMCFPLLRAVASNQALKRSVTGRRFQQRLDYALGRVRVAANAFIGWLIQ